MKEVIKKVIWSDASLASNEAESGLVLTSSIGFLVESTKDHIKIAQSKRMDTNEYEDVLTVPHKWIKKVVNN